ncbi:hypothetical protein BEK68_13855 [Ralstonia pickettii]|nr:hypothetical protein BEK68_13855 [Ralstonia pickettii]
MWGQVIRSLVLPARNLSSRFPIYYAFLPHTCIDECVLHEREIMPVRYERLDSADCSAIIDSTLLSLIADTGMCSERADMLITTFHILRKDLLITRGQHSA